MMGSRVRVTQAAPRGSILSPRARNSLDSLQIKPLAFPQCHTSLIHNGNATSVTDQSPHTAGRRLVLPPQGSKASCPVPREGHGPNLAEDERLEGGEEATSGRRLEMGDPVRRAGESPKVGTIQRRSCAAQ